jgi:hypothetical protein
MAADQQVLVLSLKCHSTVLRHRITRPGLHLFNGSGAGKTVEERRNEYTHFAKDLRKVLLAFDKS